MTVFRFIFIKKNFRPQTHHFVPRRPIVCRKMNQVYKTLPDDRPITSIVVVEDVEKCPKGYIPMGKTHDQDSDADLWRESGFFGRKCTRYMCISKTEGTQGHVVQSLIIIGEKESPPQGFKSIPKTNDSELKAWRKKQVCYKLAPATTCEAAITDVIVLSRMKKAPDEFTLLGEINGMTVCYKMGKTLTFNNALPYPPKVPYPVLPNQPKSPENGSDILRPFRPAPKPPVSTYSTISGYNGIEGVPFVLNPKYNFSNSKSKDFSFLKFKTRAQIDEEYHYEFRTERQT